MTFTTYLWIIAGLLFAWVVYMYVIGRIEDRKKMEAKREEIRLRREYGDAWYDGLKEKEEKERARAFIQKEKMRIIREADEELNRQ